VLLLVLRLDLLLERRAHPGRAEYRMHLCVHTDRLSMSLTGAMHLRSVVVRPMVVKPGANDLATLYEDGTQRKTHRGLRRGIPTLRKIKLRLRHFLFVVLLSVWVRNDDDDLIFGTTWRVYKRRS